MGKASTKANEPEDQVPAKQPKCGNATPTDFDCVWFFPDEIAIVIECVYLCISLVLGVVATISVAVWVEDPLRVLLLAGLGGYLGGWAFDTKWFYRVTARGKDDQHKHPWQRHKFYWRLFIPFVAGIIAFATYLLASSNALPLTVRDPTSGRVAFGLCFFLGLFTDVIMSKMARWAETALAVDKNNDVKQENN